MFKGETIKEAAIRKAKEEVGLDVEIERLIGVYDFIFPSCSEHPYSHCVSNLFLAKPKHGFGNIVLDSTSDDFQIVDKLDISYNTLIIGCIRDSGILKNY